MKEAYYSYMVGGNFSVTVARSRRASSLQRPAVNSRIPGLVMTVSVVRFVMMTL